MKDQVCYINRYDKINGNRVDHNAVKCASIGAGLRRMKESLQAYAKDYKEDKISKPVYHVLWIDDPHIPENSLVYVELVTDFWMKDTPLHYSVDYRLLGKEWQGYKRYDYHAGTLKYLNALIDKVTPAPKPIDPNSPEGKRMIKRNELLRERDNLYDEMRRAFGRDRIPLESRISIINDELRKL